MSSGINVLASAAVGPESLIGSSGVVDNEALLARMPALAARFTPESVLERYGVRSRQWLRGTEYSELDLGVQAARRALDAANLCIDDIGVLVAATSTSSRATSSLAGRMVHRLGARCASFDIRAGGAAGLIAWRTAELWLADEAAVALVVATEAISPWLDLDSASATPLLFADGAAALVLAPGPPTSGCTWFQTHTSSPAGRPFTVTAKLPPCPDSPPNAFVFQDSDAAYSTAMESLRAEACKQLAPHAQGAQAFFPLAPSRASASKQREALGLSCTPTYTCLEDWGCPGAAAPLIAFACQALPRPAEIALAAVGGGVHVASMVCRLAP